MHWTIPHQWWRRQGDERWRAAVKSTMMTNWSTPPPPEYHRDLLGLAEALTKEGRHELSVIVAQMACEVVSEQTLARVTKRLKGRKVFDLLDNKVREEYERLTHDRINKAPFWTAYRTHAKRRHGVVHRGRRVSPAEAKESLAVATQFVDHVENVREGLA